MPQMARPTRARCFSREGSRYRQSGGSPKVFDGAEKFARRATGSRMKPMLVATPAMPRKHINMWHAVCCRTAVRALLCSRARAGVNSHPRRPTRGYTRRAKSEERSY